MTIILTKIIRNSLIKFNISQGPNLYEDIVTLFFEA